MMWRDLGRMLGFTLLFAVLEILLSSLFGNEQRPFWQLQATAGLFVILWAIREDRPNA